MRILCLSLLVLGLLNSSSRGENAKELAGQAKAARRVLDAWHADSPEPQQRFLHIVCWTPADRDLPANYRVRLTRIMEHIQTFYAQEMLRLGFGDRSFNLNYQADGDLTLHTVHGTNKAAQYAVQSGNEIRKECLPVLTEAGIDARTETVLIFCNLATWDDKLLRFSHNSPYYAGGSFRNGTAWQLDSPELDVLNLKLKTPLIRDGQYGRISLGQHNSIFIGGIAHELGHALGLPHCSARPDEATRGTALMGSGNRTYGNELRGEGRGSFLTLAHAMRLASHPQFSGSVKGMRTTTTSDIQDLSIQAVGKSIHVSGRVRGEPPVYAIVAYFDPEGGSDYDATTATAVPAGDGKFTFSSSALQRGKPGELRLFPLHANGSAAGQMSRTRFRYAYGVNGDGIPDLTIVQTRLELTPILAALRRDDHATARELASTLKSAKASAIARNLIIREIPARTPAEYAGEDASVSLTSLKPDSARVGWNRPSYNRIPESALLLESARQLFETGIYAHAPARHTYDLGSSWQSFSGQVGLADGHNGSVQFEIKGDGKSLWKSRVLRSGSVQAFEVGLQDIDQLELLTYPTNDGPGADWSLWLEPVLRRTNDQCGTH